MGQTSSRRLKKGNGSLCVDQNDTGTSDSESFVDKRNVNRDFTDSLPDEILSIVFSSLGLCDRQNCSLVCDRWLRIEAKSRQYLSLNAKAELTEFIPYLFKRFDSVSKLSLKWDRKSRCIDDDALILISLQCKNLTRLKLRFCHGISDVGIAEFSKNCNGLRKFSCGYCAFGSKGTNALLLNCSKLEELSLNRLRGLTDLDPDPILPGSAGLSLRVICLKFLGNSHCFKPLVTGCKNLRILKIFECLEDWDTILELMAHNVKGLNEIHLEKIQITDRGLVAVSMFSDLEIFHLVRPNECTNFGLVSIAEKCKSLRKLHIHVRKLRNHIGDVGLMAVAKHCFNLQELVLIRLNPTSLSLGLIASNCLNLERLALCGSETVGDPEISCIAEKCIALKKLCIKGCPISDRGMEALANGCPSLVKVKVKNCGGVTSKGVLCLRASRKSLTVNLDSEMSEQLELGRASNTEIQEDQGEPVQFVDEQINPEVNHGWSSRGLYGSLKVKTGLFTTRRFLVRTFGKWSRNSFSMRRT